MVILLSSGQNFLSSNLSVVFLRFFSVVYLETPGNLFSEVGTERDSVHSKVTTTLVPFLAIGNGAAVAKVNDNPLSYSSDCSYSKSIINFKIPFIFSLI